MDHTPNGILLVDKAEGWTSHDIVARARRVLGTRKVGHAGTLDPMATGLLLIGAGPSTRLLTHLVGLDKTYTATVRLGFATVTDDREGDALTRLAEEQVSVSRRIAELTSNPAVIREAASQLTGQIEQAPSAVSAIKVDGKRAYDRVREGENVVLKKRAVTVHEFTLGEIPETPASVTLSKDSEADVIDIDATVRCSSGTYVRAIARDLGEKLGVGGHLIALRRTHVGPFEVTDAVPTSALEARRGDDHAATVPEEEQEVTLLDPARVAARIFPTLALSEQQAVDLGHGKRLELAAADIALAAAIAPDGRLVGLIKVEGGRTRVVTNFPTPQPSGTVPKSGGASS